MRRFLKWLAIGLGSLVGLIIVVAGGAIVVGAMLYDRHAQATVPAGYARNSSLYVEASDRTRIAIDVWLPEDLGAGARIPALIKGTPYWRAPALSLLGKALAQFSMPTLGVEPDRPILNARGYAVIVVDARGTGASFGTLEIMFSDAEVSDYGTVADWIVAQPWSNGRVGAYGFSYRGITAANIASLANPAIRAVAPLFDLADLYLLAYPGGAFESYLLSAWSAQTRALNGGKVPCAGDRCDLLVLGPKPVDADVDRKLLRQAIAEHSANYDVNDCVRGAPARDDIVCRSAQSLSAVSEIARKAKIEARGLPMFVLTGWLDESSPAQALYRFRAFSNPQDVVIGPFTHGGFENDDPFDPTRPLDIPYSKQTEMMADFFDRYLRDGGTPVTKSLRYYVNGAGAWRTSATWPPSGTSTRNWYLAPSNTLVDAVPSGVGTDRYDVDFSATTGERSRYRGQVDLSKTAYGNRAEADRRLVAYTSEPLVADLEIAGDPIAHLRLASNVTDGLVIVYLEDVAPNGTVTYVSEGVLRLAHRKPAGNDSLVLSADPFHNYLRADMGAMQPGKFDDVTIAISPIAALIRQGHRLRVAIAGADAGNLERVPAQGDAALTIELGPGSYAEVPFVR